MPFGKYKNFAQCVNENKDKGNPEAYCAYIHKKITGKWPSEKQSLSLKEERKCRIEILHEELKDEIEKPKDRFKEARGNYFLVIDFPSGRKVLDMDDSNKYHILKQAKQYAKDRNNGNVFIRHRLGQELISKNDLLKYDVATLVKQL